MTDQKPVISDAVVIMPQDVSEFEYNAEEHGTRYALSAFLSARVPDAHPPDRTGQGQYNAVWNACRSIVLKGRGG